jgi:beta-xylosidase/predicted alpha/beta superfamily hydrolase
MITSAAFRKYCRRSLVAALFLPATLSGQESGYVVTTGGSGRFALASSGRPVPLVTDSKDFPAVVRAARDLSADLKRVTGTAAPMLDGSAALTGDVVIIGTVGQSALIDQLVRNRKLDISALKGRWETFQIQVVERPLPGVERALVIAGSDRRGTVYGIYDLSAEIGVTPWYWWADVPVRRQSELHVLPGVHSKGEPKVKYRGFFINDEAPALSGWAREKFGGFNAKFYAHVFELLLRMKGNYLWPAMWGNAFYDDDVLNRGLAHEYGVVIGTSHHEPMLRAHDEWRRYGQGGAWNYEKNTAALQEFWREGIRRMADTEAIVTVGMRGDGDEPMSEDRNIAVLEKIVADQRKILEEVKGKPAREVPQLWALYKEVQDYYDRGMRVPDDVTLLFADDNWGNIRRLPLAAAPGTSRKGGYGVYYHFDYVGGPRNYKWINTNQIERVWEQMHLAYQHGVDRIWIVNVGDIKPMEFPLEFFLDYAWNPDALPIEKLPAYSRRWAAEQFGEEHAPEIARLLDTYTKFNSRRKPELLSPETYSLLHYREAERVVAEYNQLARDAERLYQQLASEYRAAFYQLVLYPIVASANINDLYVTVGRNRQYAEQGRVAANQLADRAEQLFARDAQLSAFYNDTLAGGKWPHMMDQTRIGYTYWQQPPKNVLPEVKRTQPAAAAGMGVAVEGGDTAALPIFDRFARQTFFIDVFNQGIAPFEYQVQSNAQWLRITPARGRVETEQRVEVSVDWVRAPQGSVSAPITITGPNGKRVVVRASAFNPPDSDAGFAGFVESGGVVSIEAEHYTRAAASAPFRWITIPNLGRTLSAVTAMPVTDVVTPGANSPRLEYAIYLHEADSITVHAYLSPTLDFNDRKGLRYGISIDDEPPQIINAMSDTSLRAWERSVANNVHVARSRHGVARAGAHLLKFWLVDPGVVLQKLVIDAGGLQPSYLGPPESPRAQTRQASAVKASGDGHAARFDWFRYEGRDPVYQKHQAGPGEYYNPILPGFYPDPAITRAGDDYYLVTSSFSYFPGVPIFHSRDLVNWTQIGHVLDRPSQLKVDSLRISRGVFAPMITNHNGTFYMITTQADAGGNMLVTATNPAGPWSDPVWLDFDGIDPSIFFDDDGRAYIINNGPPIGRPLYQGHRALWMQEYDTKSQKLVGPRRLVVNGGVDLSKQPIWIEAPHILKVNGTYYLIAAEGGTAEAHSEVVFRSKSVWGPWEPYQNNPILTQRHLPPDRAFPITSAGHASFVQTPAGDWWAVFLAARPYRENHYNTGRETFLLPVTWRDGWPHILTGSATVPYVHKRPNLPPQPGRAAMKTGNFVEQEDFNGPRLAPYWTFIRTVREAWHDLDSKAGWLTLAARPAHLGKLVQPSFVGRRQQHAHATVSTAMQFLPQRDGDKAGLAVFQNDDFYYLLAVTLADGRPVMQLEQSGGANANGATQVLASAPLTHSAGSTLYLKIEANGDTYDFLYAQQPDQWVALKRGADATFLSTKTAGGFVGAMFGMYAYSQPVAGKARPLSRVELPGTAVHQLRSTNTGRNYDIYVQLPGNYQPDSTKYPVIYVLDGQWDFKLLSSIVGGLVYDEVMPPAIVVGVTYTGENADYNALRAQDYTPVADPRFPGSGDAGKFLAFLEQELIPHIDRSYATDARRVLMGSSFGGLFTLYALFSKPALFTAYVSGSPALQYGGRFAFAQEAAFARQQRELNTKLYLAVGAAEPLVTPTQELAKIIRGRNYRGLQFEARVIEGERHSGNKPEAFNRALRWIFK